MCIENSVAVVEKGSAVKAVRAGLCQDFDTSETGRSYLDENGLELMRISRIELLAGN
jgi:hypothetical protein